MMSTLKAQKTRIIYSIFEIPIKVTLHNFLSFWNATGFGGSFPGVRCINDDVALSKIMKINFINIICALYVFLVLPISIEPLVGSRSAIYHSEVDQVSTGNSSDLLVKNKLFSCSSSAALSQLNPILRKRAFF